MKNLCIIALLMTASLSHGKGVDKLKTLESVNSQKNSTEASYQNRNKSTAASPTVNKNGYGNNHHGRFICESRNRQWQHCQTDTSDGVRLVRQLSQQSCQGNWGYDYYGVWVANGCRAEFNTDRYSNHWGNDYRSDDFVRCESHSYRHKTCPVGNLRGAEVEIIHQLSRNPCRNNWGFNDHEIWVKNGCKADFYVSRPHWNGPDNYPDQHGQSLLCESTGGYSQYCETPALASVTLAEIVSHDPRVCLGNWGYDQRGIWVANGCRARFNVTLFDDAYPPPPSYTSTSSHKVKCKSRKNRLKICNARNFERVELIREISKGKYPCEGNWGVNRNGELYVTNNCYAEFRVWK